MPVLTNRDKGSKARCNALTLGTRDEVAARLTELMQPFGAVGQSDKWLPDGHDHTTEPELHKSALLLPETVRFKLGEWWLTPGNVHRRGPTFDIASTCKIDGETVPGLMLIEAKAHEEELSKEAAGRKEIRANKGGIPPKTSQREHQRRQHAQIGEAIGTACEVLSSATAVRWTISHRSHYQMANRFAWAAKLTELGVPVVLIYLGFLNAREMTSSGLTTFATHEQWTNAVRIHSEPLFPFTVWNNRWACNGHAMIPLIRSVDVPMIDRPVRQPKPPSMSRRRAEG